jgi:hypothetical protein
LKQDITIKEQKIVIIDKIRMLAIAKKTLL